jgi:hypothetical protein
MSAATDFATAQGWSVEWEDDWSLGMSHAEFFCGEAYPDGEPRTCEMATLVDAEGNWLASVGCVDDADTEYREIIAAELADEAIAAMVTRGIASAIAERRALVRRAMSEHQARNVRRP